MIKLQSEVEGVRLDVFLTQAVPGLSRSAAQRLLEDGAVRKNGKMIYALTACFRPGTIPNNLRSFR